MTSRPGSNHLFMTSFAEYTIVRLDAFGSTSAKETQRRSRLRRE